MGDTVKAVFGGTTSAEKKAKKAQAEQSALLAAERDRIAKVEAGQKAVHSGGKGLLAFIEEQLPGTFG